MDDFNAFENLSDLLDDHINKINKVDSSYEKLCELHKHLNNVPQDIPHLDSMKLMRVWLSIVLGICFS